MPVTPPPAHTKKSSTTQTNVCIIRPARVYVAPCSRPVPYSRHSPYSRHFVQHLVVFLQGFNGSRKDKRKRKREKGNGDPTEDRIKIHKTGRRERQREREREREGVMLRKVLTIPYSRQFMYI